MAFGLLQPPALLITALDPNVSHLRRRETTVQYTCER